MKVVANGFVTFNVGSKQVLVNTVHIAMIVRESTFLLSTSD